jgi:hypothetical protein
MRDAFQVLSNWPKKKQDQRGRWECMECRSMGVVQQRALISAWARNAIALHKHRLWQFARKNRKLLMSNARMKAQAIRFQMNRGRRSTSRFDQGSKMDICSSAMRNEETHINSLGNALTKECDIIK